MNLNAITNRRLNRR